ncbi:MAG: acyclic terpene utilization AtuA family protein [bacterium]
MAKTKDKIYIANGQGFWGDSILGPVRLIREGRLDYLTLDYLAEVTMSIMQKLRARNPKAGYATDFIRMLERILPEAMEKGVKIISSAGGVNAQACLEATGEAIRQLGLSSVKVATVAGDDLFGRIDSFLAQGEALKNMDTGEPLSEIKHKITSANAYLGAFPIAEALSQGADIVICSRVTDPSLVLGPMIHEFGWTANDYHKLAAGTVAGHIVECGAQCTGANYTNWREIDNYALIGYPVIEATPAGDFAITKHENTGGKVSIETVASQLVYEMGDPKNYLTPDVVADFTTIRLSEDGKDRVRVSDIQGHAPTDFLKVSISYLSGYKAVGQLTIAGPDAAEKARLCADIIWQRLKYDGVTFPEENKLVELLGTNVCHDGIAPAPVAPAEVVLRVGVKDTDKNKVNRFGMEIVPLVTSGPPGVTGFAGGRPKATEIVSYWPALIPKRLIKPNVCVEAF